MVRAQVPTPRVEILHAPPPQKIYQKASRQKRWPIAAMVGGLIALLAVVSLVFFFALPWYRAGSPSRNAWVQITNFSDSATQPALSPDGHTIAFIRGPE